jgi:hypothetical protein
VPVFSCEKALNIKKIIKIEGLGLGWVRVTLRKFSLRLEPAALEVKGKCANHFVTEVNLFISRL